MKMALTFSSVLLDILCILVLKCNTYYIYYIIRYMDCCYNCHMDIFTVSKLEKLKFYADKNYGIKNKLLSSLFHFYFILIKKTNK